MAKAAAGAAAPASITGTATFVTGSRGVTLNVMVSGCTNDKTYPIHIHTGSSCESLMSQQGHWDMMRGEGIPNIVCGNKQGSTMVVRDAMDPATAWSVGDGSATDVVGHVLVVHDADEPTWRIACGPIVKN
jgi:Cu/Zn superoxide dismutase